MIEYRDFDHFVEDNKKLVEWGDRWTVPIILAIVIASQIIKVIAYYL